MADRGEVGTARQAQPQRIGVYGARTRWYELLRRAQVGEVFIITYRGVPKAELWPNPLDHLSLKECDGRRPSGDT
ncbi:hypothetical protein BH24CHL3_BH24CHL3_00110 [soil metagenome]